MYNYSHEVAGKIPYSNSCLGIPGNTRGARLLHRLRLLRVEGVNWMENQAKGLVGIFVRLFEPIRIFIAATGLQTLGLRPSDGRWTMLGLKPLQGHGCTTQENLSV